MLVKILPFENGIHRDGTGFGIDADAQDIRAATETAILCILLPGPGGAIHKRFVLCTAKGASVRGKALFIYHTTVKRY